MPRPKVPGAPEPKKRSRTGCWNCKAKKIKCGEEKPKCSNCIKNGEDHCDYSIRLNWDSRLGKKRGHASDQMNVGSSHKSGSIPGMSTMSFTVESGQHNRSLSHSTTRSSATFLSQIDNGPRSGSPTTASTFSENPSPLVSPPFFTGSPNGTGPQLHERPSGPHPLNPAKKPRYGSSSDPIVPQSDYSFSYRSHHSSISSDIRSDVPQFTNPYTLEPLDPALYQDLPNVGPDQSMPPPNGGRGSVINQLDGLRKGSVAYDPDDDPRRMSVNSLLIKQESEAMARPPLSRCESDDNMRFYGIDRGLPDLDMPKNKDSSVLDMNSPLLGTATAERRDSSTEFGFASTANGAFGYDGPMQVKIPKSLLPLPEMLTNNPMNLMYFHFFIERTASILVPHDCPANPFKIILPQMAVRDDNLMSLLLAYSASHRARLLGQPEPNNRIATWVSGVFAHLGQALDTNQITPANVATAILLASLEIVAPGTFGVEIPWQQHLSIARRMIAARGGPKGIEARDRVSHFLIRWFAYLDVIGNFSTTGMSKDALMFKPELYEFDNEEEDYKIDCMLGFSGFLAGLLARIADLSHRCDLERLSALGEVNPDWRPSPQIVEQAEKLKADLAIARGHTYTLCPHRHSPTESEAVWEAAEMVATNLAYHWAGMIHLNRRILGLSSKSTEVQSAVLEIIGTIYKIRKGGSAEVCLVFPLITAGCQVQKATQQKLILERIKSIEDNGMTQVQKARKLLEQVWETGQPWETLVHGEFFG